MYKRVGGWEGDGGWWGWVGSGGGLHHPIGLFGVAMSPRRLVIGLDKPRWPMRYLTNTGVNIRSIPPI